MDNLTELFTQYWWLLLILVFFAAGGFSSIMRYQRTKAKIELFKAYAEAGKEPPAELLRNLERDDDQNFRIEMDEGSSDGNTGNAFLVFLFFGLSGVFAFEGYAGLIGMGEVAYFVAMIMSVLGLAFLANAIFSRRG
ncbi:MAG: hypothetical protein GYB36_09900 [Alphaproteobacteria bacterium]|nr:hypothetical protein [Alphaproteobacteria bacterium]